MTRFLYDTLFGGIPREIRRSGGEPDHAKAAERWRLHYNNLLTLDRLSRDQGLTPNDRAQARIEMDVAQRKLAWWARHMADGEDVARQAGRVKTGIRRRVRAADVLAGRAPGTLRKADGTRSRCSGPTGQL